MNIALLSPFRVTEEVQEGAAHPCNIHHQVAHSWVELVHMGLPPQVPTEEEQRHREGLMGDMEHQDREGSMDLGQQVPLVDHTEEGMPLVGLMGAMEDSLREDIMDSIPLQVTGLRL